jgi:hypothetical protein
MTFTSFSTCYLFYGHSSYLQYYLRYCMLHVPVRALLKNCVYLRFVFLPENSTHMLQPLDVSVFGPMKKRWKADCCLKGLNYATIPKQVRYLNNFYSECRSIIIFFEYGATDL